MLTVREWPWKWFFTNECSHAVELAVFLLVYADLKWKLLMDSLHLICPFMSYWYILVQHIGLLIYVPLLKMRCPGCGICRNEKNKDSGWKNTDNPSIHSEVSASELIKHWLNTWRILQRTESTDRKKLCNDLFLMFTTIKKY